MYIQKNQSYTKLVLIDLLIGLLIKKPKLSLLFHYLS